MDAINYNYYGDTLRDKLEKYLDPSHNHNGSTAGCKQTALVSPINKVTLS